MSTPIQRVVCLERGGWDDLLEVTEALSRAVSVEAIARTLVERGRAVFGAACAALWATSPDGQHVSLIDVEGCAEAVADRLRQKPVEDWPPLGSALQTGEPIWLDQALSQDGLSLGCPEAGAVACLPFVIEGRTIGAMALFFDGAHRFDDHDRKFQLLVARHFAQAIDRIRQLERAKQIAEQQAWLLDVTVKLAEVRSTEDPRALTDEERSFILAVAEEGAQALRRAGLHAASLHSSRTLGAVVRASPMAIMLVDPNERVRLWNPAAERLFGWTAGEILGQPFPAGDRSLQEEFRDNLRKVAFGQPIVGAETRRRRKDGSTFDVGLWAAPVEHDDGLVQCLAIMADITDRKRVEAQEKALREEAHRAHDRMLALFVQAPVAIAIYSGPDHVIEFGNPTYLTFAGRGAEILGKPYAEAFAVDAAPIAKRLLDEVHRTGEPRTAESRAVRRGGDGVEREAFFRVSVVPLREGDEQIRGLMTVGIEVTDQVLARRRVEKAQAAASTAEERLRLALSSAEIGTWDYDLVTGALDWDARCKAMFGLPPHAPVDYATFLSGLHPEDRGRVDDVVQRMREPGSPQDFALEYRTLGFEDGVLRWISARGRMFFEAQRAVRFIGTVLDVTDLKIAEEQRAVLLKREQAARAEAEALSRIKDEFLATVSHELRTPLNAISGWIQMLRSDALSEENRRRAIDVIERNARAQEQLIADLLDVSRVISGRLRLNIGRVEMVQVIDMAIEAVNPAAKSKGVAIVARMGQGIEHVIGDAERLQQVIWNLLTNAVKFTPSGGRVEVHVTQEVPNAVVTVRDTGQGIRAEFLPHLFEPFRQADASFARSHRGLGLGLAISRTLVEMHGGTIEARSEGEGRGTTFVVRVPIAAMRPEATPRVPALSRSAPEPRAAAKDALDELCILVVEDEPDSRELLLSLLEQYGAKVYGAASAAEALEKFKHAHPEIVVSDLGLPGEDGLSLIRKIRGLPDGSRIAAAALTAFVQDGDKVRALQAGFDDHISKPIDPERLVDVIGRLARERRRGASVRP